MKDTVVETQHLGFIGYRNTAKPKPANLHESEYGAKKPIRESNLKFILTFALINVVLFAAMWTVVSMRGKCSACPEVTLEAPCEDDWIWYRRKCYYFSKQYDEWQKSQDFCVAHNASLANIDSQEELDFLMRFKGSSNHWIGLSRSTNDTGWIWTNGTLYSEDIFQIERLQTTPSNSGHVFLHENGIKSESGRYVKKFICNKRLFSLPKPHGIS